MQHLKENICERVINNSYYASLLLLIQLYYFNYLMRNELNIAADYSHLT